MNYLHFTLLILILTIPNFLAKTKERNAGLFTKLEGYVLKAKALKENKVRSDFECGLRCARYEQCYSFNFALKADRKGLHSCQLLETNEIESRGLLSDSREFHYFRRIELPCENRPCLNGATCTEAPGGGSRYHCHCPPGFKGVKCETVKWVKFNQSPVSVGTQSERTGKVTITMDGYLITMKVVYIDGYVTRYKDKPETRSHWYANQQGTGRPLPGLGIIISDQYRNLIIPEKKDMDDRYQHSYTIPGYNSMSPEIVFKNLTKPRSVRALDKLEIWFRQDYINAYEFQCDGTLKIDVYGLYV